MLIRNLFALTALFLLNTGAFATTCNSYEWSDISKTDGAYRFKVSQVCNLGYLPNITVEDVNEITIDQKKQMASEIFLEDNNDPDYLFSSEEKLNLKNGDVDLRSKNFGKIYERGISKFKSVSQILQAKGQAKYIKSLSNEVLSQKTQGDELMVKVRTTMFLNKPPVVPIDLLKNKVKKDMEEDLSRYAGDLHNAILNDPRF
ncbi:MAG: hypothetical protein HRU09_09635 [Oligoflexales bacterium]|nr:hypothetical protein [Oligoflexales bacterium]